eukprot:scaffold2874_cov116-Isochrysis_galbana.AAC.3
MSRGALKRPRYPIVLFLLFKATAGIEGWGGLSRLTECLASPLSNTLTPRAPLSLSPSLRPPPSLPPGPALQCDVRHD